MKRRKRRKKRTYYCFPAKALLDQFEEGTWANVIAQALDVSRGTVQRWRDEPALLSPYQADGLAIKLGLTTRQLKSATATYPSLGSDLGSLL